MMQVRQQPYPQPPSTLKPYQQQPNNISAQQLAGQRLSPIDIAFKDLVYSVMVDAEKGSQKKGCC